MSKFIVTLKRKIFVSGGDVVDDYIKLNTRYEDELVFANFQLDLFISDDGNYAEIHGTYIGSSDFNEWYTSAEVRESMLSKEQSRLDYMKDKIDIARYLDWDDTAVTTEFKSLSEFIPSDLVLTQRFV
jgi:hypothetical protein